MIVVFDMDDTLYEELTYVRSGFRAVADAAADLWRVDAEAAFRVLLDSLERDGRGRQFDELGRKFGHPQRHWVEKLVRVYRHHRPDIALPDETREVLSALADHPLYVVTDGHKVVQQKKVDALGLAPWFRRIYLTNRYGIRHQKPSPYVFQLIARRERAEPGDIVYVGDNPRKDFCGIRPLGFRTIRVKQGHHADVVVAAGRDAEVTVGTLKEVVPIITNWSRKQAPR